MVAASPVSHLLFRQKEEEGGRGWGEEKKEEGEAYVSTILFDNVSEVLHDRVSLKRIPKMTKKDYGHYDYIVAMDRYNLRNMARYAGNDPDKKVSLLLDWTDRPGDVADPWYSGDFQSTWDDVNEGCEGLLKYILKNFSL